MNAFRIILCSALLSAVTSGFSEVNEEILPKDYPVTRYSAVWENSPFTRELVKPIVQTVTSSFARNLSLRGIAKDRRRGTVAYVQDLRENKSYAITSAKSDKHPYVVVSANHADRPNESVVTISDGKETADIGYADGLISEAIRAPAQRARPSAEARDGRNQRAAGAKSVVTKPGQAARPGGQARPPGFGRPGQVPQNPQAVSSRPAQGQANTTPGSPPAQAEEEELATEKIDEPRRRRIQLPRGAEVSND